MNGELAGVLAFAEWQGKVHWFFNHTHHMAPGLRPAPLQGLLSTTTSTGMAPLGLYNMGGLIRKSKLYQLKTFDKNIPIPTGFKAETLLAHLTEE